MGHLLGAEQVGLEFPNRAIFRNLTIGIAEGDRIGVVGRNGDGKSTLIEVLAGLRQPDHGAVTTRRDTRIGFLHQTDRADSSLTVRAAVVGDRADHEWASEARIRDIFDGLLGEIDPDALIAHLSGGQARRVALAGLLSRDWDVLFLDEPTNHLDVEAVAWLAGHLGTRWPDGAGALVTVTHDRWFLDAACTTTWEVHDGIVDRYDGGYAAYIQQRFERERHSQLAEAKRQNLLRKELAWLSRGAPARTSKPKFRLEAVAMLAGDPPPRDRVELTRLATARIGKTVVDLEDVSLSYGDRQVLHDVTWRLAPGERTGILGPNGAGKSSLLSLIVGDQSASAGRIKRGSTLRIAMLSQTLAELDPIADDRVADVVARLRREYQTDGKTLSATELFERLGFDRASLSTLVRDLSGGQARRLQLLVILLDEPNLLILDEPTNDLDTDMLTALEDLLDSWPGTLIVVSHDRYLLERVTDQQYGILDGRLRHLPGGVDDYLRRRAAGPPAGATRAHQGLRAPARSDAAPAASANSATLGAAPGAVVAPAASRHLALTGAERRGREKQLAAIERKLSRAALARDSAAATLAAHDQSDYLGLAPLAAELADCENAVRELERQWLSVAEQLES